MYFLQNGLRNLCHNKLIIVGQVMGDILVHDYDVFLVFMFLLSALDCLLFRLDFQISRY